MGLSDPATFGKEVTGTLLENVTISYCSRVAGYFRGDGLVIRNSLSATPPQKGSTSSDLPTSYWSGISSVGTTSSSSPATTGSSEDLQSDAPRHFPATT
ncbi:MAG: hypothetical protein WDO73_01965 [Ignavibacteriota bacterium]